MAAHRMKISGEVRKNSQLKPVRSALVKVSTFDHGQLRVRVPAEPDEDESEVAAPHPHVEGRATHEPILEKEDDREHAQGDRGDRDRDGVRLPDLQP